MTPALKAARTAFSLPMLNEPAPSSAASWRRCGFASAPGFSLARLGGRRPRRSASVVKPQAAHRFLHHPIASVLQPNPSARNGAAAKPGCPVRVCPLEQPRARPPSRSTEAKTGLVLAPQAAGLACPNYAASGSPRQRLAGARSAPWRWSRLARHPLSQATHELKN